MPNAGKDAKELNLLHCQEWEIVQPPWGIIWQFLIKPNMNLPYDPVFAVRPFISKKWKLLLHTHTQACMWLLKAVLLVRVICNNSSNILQQVVKRNCNISIPWNTYYSAVKLNDLLISAVTQVYSKRNMLSEKIQSQKVVYCMVTFIIL